MNETDIQATNTDCKHKLYKLVLQIWLVNNNVVPGSTKMLTQEHVVLGKIRFCGRCYNSRQLLTRQRTFLCIPSSINCMYKLSLLSARNTRWRESESGWNACVSRWMRERLESPDTVKKATVDMTTHRIRVYTDGAWRPPSSPRLYTCCSALLVFIISSRFTAGHSVYCLSKLITPGYWFISKQREWQAR